MQIFLKTKSVIAYLFMSFQLALLAGTSGKIAGSISDQNGNPLIGCNIIIDQIGLGVSTDVDGNYYIVNIPAGAYTISATMIGYKTIKVKDIVVN